jgi:hypothetical protein
MLKKLAIVCLCSFALLARADVWEVDFLVGVLNEGEEVPPTASTATGGELGAGMTYDDAANILTLNVGYGVFGFYQPLEGNYSDAHIHQGALGVNGPPIAFGSLSGGHVPLGTKAGLWSDYDVTLTAAEETALFNGDLYMNIHSSLFPAGEIRGQLSVVPIPEPGTVGLALLGLGVLGLARRRMR